MGKFIYRFITLIFISIMLSCSGGSSTQSVEDVGDDTSGENSGGNGGGKFNNLFIDLGYSF